jgi:carboxymethylenebutenolidase
MLSVSITLRCARSWAWFYPRPGEGDAAVSFVPTSYDLVIPVEGGEVAAVMFRPAGDGRWPAIVLGAEATGINTFIREIGSRLAAEGFVAVVYDFFRGAGPEDSDDYSDLPAIMDHISRIDFRRATYDLLSTVDYLRAQSFVDAEHVLAWGYCTGGTIALLAGCLDRTLAGTVLFYPSQPVFDELNHLRPAHPRDLVWNHRAPMLLLYGDSDGAVPNPVQDDLRGQLKRWNIDATTRVYAGAGHVFAGKHFGDAYRQAADRDSWELALEFARQHSASKADSGI